MTDDTPRLGVIKRINGVAGQYALDVTVTYPGEAPYLASFVGSAYGGRVIAMGPSGLQTVVSAEVMERCGDMLTPEWVRRFFRVDEPTPSRGGHWSACPADCDSPNCQTI